MRKILTIGTLISLSACSGSDSTGFYRGKSVDKPPLEFSVPKLAKPNLITHDRCYMLNSPKTPVVCMLPEEYTKDTQNYLILLEILKRYQISEQYNRP
jgi:hypothetical protein